MLIARHRFYSQILWHGQAAQKNSYVVTFIVHVWKEKNNYSYVHDKPLLPFTRTYCKRVDCLGYCTKVQADFFVSKIVFILAFLFARRCSLQIKTISPPKNAYHVFFKASKKFLISFRKPQVLTRTTPSEILRTKTKNNFKK